MGDNNFEELRKKAQDAVNNVSEHFKAAIQQGGQAANDAKKAIELVQGYNDYLQSLNNDTKNADSFNQWVKTSPFAKTTSPAAQAEARAYFETYDVIAKSIKNATDQGKIIFEEAKEGAMDHMWGLGALLAIGLGGFFTGQFGGANPLGGWITGLLAVVAGIAVDAFTAGDHSFFSQITGAFQPKKPETPEQQQQNKIDAETRERDVRRNANVDPAPPTPDYQEPLAFKNAEIVSKNSVTVSLVNGIEVNGGDPSWPRNAGSYVDIQDPVKKTTIRLYGNIDEQQQQFKVVDQRDIGLDPRTSSTLYDMHNISIPVRKENGRFVALMNDDDLSAKIRIESALSFNNAPADKIASAQAESDFVSGKFDITEIKQTGKDVKIIAASNSNPDITRVFGGTMDKDGNLRINKIYEQNPNGTSKPHALDIDTKLIKSIPNMGTTGSLQEIDKSKLTKEVLKPIVAQFGPDVDHKDIVHEIKAPANLPPRITTLNIPGKGKVAQPTAPSH